MNTIDNVIKYSSGLQVLYVEDHEEARSASLCIFEEFFENIIVAEDGEEGFNKFCNHNIDLVITDINMPKLNGLGMLAKIREMDKNTPVLVLSAYNESGFFIESIRLGVEGYLLKPIELDQFVFVLEKVVEKIKLTNEKHISENFLQQYKEITDKSSNVSIVDPNGVLTYVNDEFCRLSGYSKAELIGQRYEEMQQYKQPESIINDIWDTIKVQKKIWKGIVKNINKRGDSYYVDMTIKPILDMNGEIIEFIAIRNDVTAVMNHKKLLQDVIEESKTPFVALLKIDDYENLSVFYGHKISLMIQEEFAKHILTLLPQTSILDKVYILENGEFALAKDLYNQNIDIDQIIKELKLLQHEVLQSKLSFENFEYDASFILSIAYGEECLENAQFGLKSLSESKQNFTVANGLAHKEHVQAELNMKTLQMVKKALEEYKIISYFQPIVNNTTKEVEKYESLVRLINEENEVISPYFFLDIAKKGKYYSQITAIVLQNSFDALSQTSKDITINISALDIEKTSTRNIFFQLLEKYKKDAPRLVLELLEDESAKDFKVIKSFIHEVKQYGIKIAIDDFGAGYSNFERLLDYQPDILKIDGCLIKNIENDTFSLSVVKTIVSFAKEQNILTVAEFVENENIFKILSELGIDYSQGYFFGKPVALEEQ
ncbi:MAG: EAL domain-containing protein [Campylobacterota bacterium]|nr:EAL domain-containing protein [Campylobacterota bacterium]